MTILAVDLAAKYSAACLMGDNYQVIDQWDSWQKTEEMFIYSLVGYWCWFDEKPPGTPELMVIEDLPHGLAYSTLVKSVLRLQGRIVQAMHEMPHGRTEDVLFLAPAEWRKHYDLKRGTGPAIVVPTAAEFGYEPPDLSDRAKGVKGGKAVARKVATDYCSAYLIARWALETKGIYETYDVTGTSRYDTAAIKKKDFDAQDR